MNPPATVDLAHKTILALDDDASMRAVIRTALDRHGCQHILAAGSGERALELLAEQPVDLVICDMQMEPMNGLDFLAIARSRPGLGNFKVLMLTAGSPDIDPDIGDERLRRLGIDAWVFKPISVTRLIEALAAVLGGRIEAVMPEAETAHVLAAIAEKYTTRLHADVVRLKELAARLGEGGGGLPTQWQPLRKHLHDMKGQAGTFGFDLVTALAAAGDALLAQASHAARYGITASAELARAMQVIASAMAIVVENGIRGPGGAPGQKLLARIDDFNRPLKEKFIIVKGDQPANFRPKKA